MRSEDASSSQSTNGSHGGSSRRARRNGDDVPDSVLIQRFISDRDQSAFATIVERYSRLVFGVALRHLRDRNRAEDVFQATFLVLAENARKIRKRKSLASWLHGVARRIALRAMSEAQRLASWEENMEPASTLFGGVGESFERQTLDEELAQLPEKYRDPITLHYLEGLTLEEIAQRLGLSVDAVDGRLKRGRKDLRLRLARRGVSLAIAVGVFQMSQQAASAATFSTLVTSTSVAAHAWAAGTAVSSCTPNAVLLAGKEIATMAAAKTTIVLMLTGVCCLAAGFVVASGDGEGAGSASAGGAGLSSLVSDDAAAGGGEEGGVSFAGSGIVAEDAAGEQLIMAYQLQNVAVAQVEATIREMMPGLTVNADQRSNMLLVLATSQQHEALRQLLDVIDSAEAPTGGGGDAGGEMMGMPGSGTPGAGYPGMGSGSSGGAGMEMMMGMGSGMMSGAGPTSVDYGPHSENRERIESAFDQVTNVEFQDMPLSQAMDYIAQVHDIPIRIDVAALQDEGVTPDEALTFTVAGISLENAMEIMLSDVNGARLDYLIKNDVLFITTAIEAEEFMETRLYEMRNYQGLTPSTAMDLIQSGTSGIWYDIDGDGGKMVAIDGGLMIRQTQRVHREIHELLEQMQRFSSTGLETPPQWQDVDANQYGFPGMMGGGMMGGS